MLAVVIILGSIVTIVAIVMLRRFSRNRLESFSMQHVDNMNREGHRVLGAGDWACRPGGVPMIGSGLLRAQTLASTKKTYCMLGSTATSVLEHSGGCSKTNDALYESSFGDVVDDISMQEAVKGAAKCTITLNAPPRGQPGPHRSSGRMPASGGRLRSYDKFLRRRSIEISPMYVTMKMMYEDMVERYKQKKKDYENMQDQVKEKKRMYTALNKDYLAWVARTQTCLGKEAAAIAEANALKKSYESCTDVRLPKCKDVLQSYLIRAERELFVNGPSPKPRRAVPRNVSKLRRSFPVRKGPKTPDWWTLPQPVVESIRPEDDDDLSSRPVRRMNLRRDLDRTGSRLVASEDVVCRVGSYEMKAAPLVRTDVREADKRYAGCVFHSSWGTDLLPSRSSCSKSNPRIYSDAFEDLIDDVRFSDASEGVRKCVVTFRKPDPASLVNGYGASTLEGQAKQYDNFVYEAGIQASAEYKKMVAMYEEMYNKYLAMVALYDAEYLKFLEISKQYDDLRDTRDKEVAAHNTCQSSLAKANAEKQSITALVATCETQYNVCMAKIKKIKDAFDAKAREAEAKARAAREEAERRRRGARLEQNNCLGTGAGLTSEDGRFTFVNQGDGNVVLYKQGRPLWASRTNQPNKAGKLCLLPTGWLALHNPKQQLSWVSHRQKIGKGPFFLVIQDDGNAVIYGSTGPVWHTSTHGS